MAREKTDKQFLIEKFGSRVSESVDHNGLDLDNGDGFHLAFGFNEYDSLDSLEMISGNADEGVRQRFFTVHNLPKS